MAKPFRVMQIEFNGSRYVLDRHAAELMLDVWSAFGDEQTSDVLRALVRDLRAALATVTEAAETVNPFDSEEACVEQTVAVRLEAQAGEKPGGPVCFLCEQAGRELKGQALFVCDMPGCPRQGKPSARAYFETGVR